LAKKIINFSFKYFLYEFHLTRSMKFFIAQAPSLESISSHWLRFSFDAGIFFMALAPWLIVFIGSH